MMNESNQENTGQDAIQINGNYNTVNHHEHSHIHHHRHHHTVHAHGPLHLHIGAHEFALQAPPAPPARARPDSKLTYDISPTQKGLLALMRPLPKHVRVGVLDFMRVEFGTGMVMELDPQELIRVRQVVLDARRIAGL